MIVNGLRKHEIKQIRRVLICAYWRCYNQFMQCGRDANVELHSWYEHGLRELNAMIAFSERAIRESKR